MASKMITREAVARLRPRPPASVEMRKRRMRELRSLKCDTIASRSETSVVPSKRR